MLTPIINLEKIEIKPPIAAVTLCPKLPTYTSTKTRSILKHTMIIIKIYHTCASKMLAAKNYITTE